MYNPGCDCGKRLGELLCLRKKRKKRKNIENYRQTPSSLTREVAAIPSVCAVAPCGAAGATVPQSTWASSCGFFCFNLPSHPAAPLPSSIPPSVPSCRSLSAAVALGSASEWCHHPPYIYRSLYMCIIAVRTKRPAGPRSPGLPLPWLVVGVVSTRPSRCSVLPLARGPGLSLSSFRLPQHLSEPGRRRCPSSPWVFSEYLSIGSYFLYNLGPLPLPFAPVRFCLRVLSVL